MSCLITKGRILPCKEFIGGLYKVWFANFGTITPTIDVNNIVTSLSAATLYEYELKGTSKLLQELTSSRDNGTTFITQTLTLDLVGIDYNTNNEIVKIAHGRPHVIVQDNYGSAWLVGRVRGAELTTSANDTGAQLGDKYGYLVTIVGMERDYANFMSGSTITNAFAGITPTPTFVKGS